MEDEALKLIELMNVIGDDLMANIRFAGREAVEAKCKDAATALEAQDRRIRELEGALGKAKCSLELAGSVPAINPHFADEVAALGRRIGYGALMSAASALWRDELDDLAGGEFVCGPCRATVESNLRLIRTTLSNQGDEKSPSEHRG